MPFIGRQPLVGNYIKLDAITTSATTTFNLTAGGVAVYPQTATNCIVSLNGIIQAPTDAYTISGSTIVFASALTTSDVIDFITVLGDVLNIGTPSDGTVGFAKVTSNLITGATAETAIADADTLLIYDDSATALRKMTKSNLFSGIANTPAFQAKLSSNQTISHNTLTKLQFSNEQYDTNSAYDPTTNYRFTVPTGQGGKYFFYAGISMVGTNNREHEIILRFYVNGVADQLMFWSDDLTQSTATGANLFAVISISATDYVEVYVTQYDYTASSTMTVLDTTRSIFGAYKLIGV